MGLFSKKTQCVINVEGIKCEHCVARIKETLKKSKVNADINKEEKLVKVIPYITEFFDKVLVMDKDEKIKQNRLSMLYAIKQKFAKIADFSKIVF